ncbi:hypothetical protein [Streptomyces sp. HB2AG]|uniref:hypothetical protein n=1 Tax=Streptomyces sp. HB2AG TaxID=2983400 RepID=UPI0022AA9C99|nr:hypothetical protein [Streptomyces sp. HB2AG]MCZ2526252.1 hypothetical protein [Streptomyces sp. HB2AG]
MPTALKILLFVIGALLLVLAFIGGGVSIREFSVPRMQRIPRLFAAGAGTVLVLTSVVLFAVTEEEGGDGPVTGSTPTPSPTASTPTQAPTSSPPPSSPTNSLGEIGQHIPQNFVDDCRPMSDLPRGAVEGAECDRSPDAPEYVDYISFPDSPSMNSYVTGLLGVTDVSELPKSNCKTREDFENGGYSNYETENGQHGFIICAVVDNKPIVLWTEEFLSIVAMAEEEHLDVDLEAFINWAMDMEKSGPVLDNSSSAATAAAPGS